jgi:hypothetical protein
MSDVNEISGLVKISVKPMAWRIIENMDKTYRLDFTYVSPSRGDWAEVRTSRGEVKTYRKIDTLVGDIKKVQLEPVIHAEFL